MSPSFSFCCPRRLFADAALDFEASGNFIHQSLGLLFIGVLRVQVSRGIHAVFVSEKWVWYQEYLTLPHSPIEFVSYLFSLGISNQSSSPASPFTVIYVLFSASESYGSVVFSLVETSLFGHISI